MKKNQYLNEIIHRKNLVNYKGVSHVNSFHVSYYVITQLSTYASQTHPKLLD